MFDAYSERSVFLVLEPSPKIVTVDSATQEKRETEVVIIRKKTFQEVFDFEKAASLSILEFNPVRAFGNMYLVRVKLQGKESMYEISHNRNSLLNYLRWKKLEEESKLKNIPLKSAPPHVDISVNKWKA